MLVMALAVKEARTVTATSTVANGTPTATFFATNATATLSGANKYPILEGILREIDYTVFRATMTIVNFRDTVGKMRSASRSLMKHIGKDFVGFIQANLAPVYFYFDSFRFIAENVGRWLKKHDFLEELEILSQLCVGYEYLRDMAWEERMSVYLDLFKGSIESVVSGIKRALRDSHMDDVIRVIEETLKLLPLKDFNNFVHFLEHQMH